MVAPWGIGADNEEGESLSALLVRKFSVTPWNNRNAFEHFLFFVKPSEFYFNSYCVFAWHLSWCRITLVAFSDNTCICHIFVWCLRVSAWHLSRFSITLVTYSYNTCSVLAWHLWCSRITLAFVTHSHDTCRVFAEHLSHFVRKRLSLSLFLKTKASHFMLWFISWFLITVDILFIMYFRYYFLIYIDPNKNICK